MAQKYKAGRAEFVIISLFSGHKLFLSIHVVGIKLMFSSSIQKAKFQNKDSCCYSSFYPVTQYFPNTVLISKNTDCVIYFHMYLNQMFLRSTSITNIYQISAIAIMYTKKELIS